jgi:hypothetical protein
LKLFFDSSVLVPVFYADHPHPDASARAFLAAGKEDFCALGTLGIPGTSPGSEQRSHSL